MANPQTENGFVSIATELFERICSVPINGSEFRVMLFTIRKTYGFKKKFDWISLTQYQVGTGLPRSNIVKTLSSLVVKRLLSKEENRYGVNKNYTEWLVVKRLPPVVKRLPFASSQTTTHKRNYTKEINTVAKATPTMKKNKFGSYREDAPSDSGEDVVDLDTGEIVEEEKKKNVAPIYKELIRWAEERRRAKFMTGTMTKQFKAFKEARAFNLNPADLKKRWLDMEVEQFWQDKGFDWTTVVYSFNKKPK